MKEEKKPPITWFSRRPQEGAIALLVPGDFSIFAASLGIQQVYRLLTDAGLSADLAWCDKSGAISTYTGRKISSYQVIGIALSYELEIINLISCLKKAGIPLFAKERGRFDPILLAGGPLISINRKLLINIVDAAMVGGAEENVVDFFCAATAGRAELLKFAQSAGNIVTENTIESAAPLIKLGARPASSILTSPMSAFPNIYMVEIARGCPSRCAFCSLSALSEKLRFLAKEAILEAVPEEVQKVGLVSATPTDHPDIMWILQNLVKNGKRVSLSSLRVASLSEEMMDILVAGGLRSLTIAADGTSERLRRAVHKPVNKAGLLRGLTLAQKYQLKSLKIYSIIALPGETNEDLDEFITLIREMHDMAPQIALTLSLSPFVPKPHTELGGAEIAPITEMQSKLKYIKKALKTICSIVGDAPKTAHLEYKIAHSAAISAESVLDFLIN